MRINPIGYSDDIYYEGGCIPPRSRMFRSLKKSKVSLLLAIATSLLIVKLNLQHEEVVTKLTNENKQLHLTVEALRRIAIEPKAVLVIAQDSESLYSYVDTVQTELSRLRELKQRKDYKK